jgi:hypothetical protein
MPGSSQDKTTIIESMLSKILDRLNEPKENFSEILDDLYSYGEYLKETRFNTLSNQEKYLIKKGKKVISLTQESGFREHIKKVIVNQNDVKEPKKKPLLSRLGLQKLSVFMTAWEDPYFRNGSESQVTRQYNKNKRFIDKQARHAIHAALFALCQTINPDSTLDPKKSLRDYLKSLTPLYTEMADVPPINLSEGEQRDKNRTTTKVDTDKFQEKAQQSSPALNQAQQKEYLQSAERAITTYTPPTKKQRAIKIFSILLAIIVGLTAGLATAGAIYLFLPTMPLWGSILVAGVIFGGVGFYSNYSFFAETLPDFFQMIARGELTQYIDKETGERKKMGWFRKCLLGLAFIFALSVGVVSAALLVGAIISFVPLPLALVLGFFYCVALTITMFYAFVKVIKDPISCSEIKAWFKNLTARQILGVFIKGAFTALVLFGIGFGCKVSVVTLVTLLSAACPFISVPIISAIVIGLAVVSFVGQVPFAVLSVSKFYDVTVDFFTSLFCSSQDPQRVKEGSGEKQRWSTCLLKLLSYVSLIINALGNAVLVVIKGLTSSIFAAVGAGLYSFAGNIPEPNYTEQRTNASVYNCEFIQEAWSKPTHVVSETVTASDETLSLSQETKKIDQVTQSVPVKASPRLYSLSQNTLRDYDQDLNNEHTPLLCHNA